MELSFEEYRQRRSACYLGVFRRILFFLVLAVPPAVIFFCIVYRSAGVLIALAAEIFLLPLLKRVRQGKVSDRLFSPKTEKQYEKDGGFLFLSYKDLRAGADEKELFEKREWIVTGAGLLIFALFFLLLLFPAISANTVRWQTERLETSGFDTAKYRALDKIEGRQSSYILYSGNEGTSYHPERHDLEHIYAKSWAKEKQNNLNDPCNLRLADKVTNRARGNAYFAEVKTKDRPVTGADGKITGYLGKDGNTVIFEPVHDKGDIARAILYMCETYHLSYPYTDTMRKWAKEAPQNDEIHHNESIRRSADFRQRNVLVESRLIRDGFCEKVGLSAHAFGKTLLLLALLLLLVSLLILIYLRHIRDDEDLLAYRKWWGGFFTVCIGIVILPFYLIGTGISVLVKKLGKKSG